VPWRSVLRQHPKTLSEYGVLRPGGGGGGVGRRRKRRRRRQGEETEKKR